MSNNGSTIGSWPQNGKNTVASCHINRSWHFVPRATHYYGLTLRTKMSRRAHVVPHCRRREFVAIGFAFPLSFSLNHLSSGNDISQPKLYFQFSCFHFSFTPVKFANKMFKTVDRLLHFCSCDPKYLRTTWPTNLPATARAFTDIEFNRIYLLIDSKAPILRCSLI